MHQGGSQQAGPASPRLSLFPVGPLLRVLGALERWSLGWEEPLEEAMATHSGILARKIPWTEEPARLWSVGSQRVGCDWATKHTHTKDALVYYGQQKWGRPPQAEERNTNWVLRLAWGWVSLWAVNSLHLSALVYLVWFHTTAKIPGLRQAVEWCQTTRATARAVGKGIVCLQCQHLGLVDMEGEVH